MSQTEPTVFVVDDDEVIRNTIAQLVETVNLNAKCFASAQDFLDAYDPVWPGCLVLDLRMPGMSGLKLQAKLAEENICLPIIFVTGHGDVLTASEAFKAGAVDFIEKPFRNQVLLDQIETAISRDANIRLQHTLRQSVEAKLALLTAREMEVMNLVIAGKANKVIAVQLGLGQRTVEVHRAHVMEKMGVDSLAELVKMASGIDHAQR